MSEQHEHEQQPEPDPVEQSNDVAALRTEAANRRRALRATEAERDGLKARLDQYDKQAVEALAAEKLEDPADLWLATSIDAMQGEDGTIDMEKVAEEVDKVVEQRPHWRKASPPHPVIVQGAREPEPPPPPSFGDQLRRETRR